MNTLTQRGQLPKKISIKRGKILIIPVTHEASSRSRYIFAKQAYIGQIGTFAREFSAMFEVLIHFVYEIILTCHVQHQPVADAVLR